MLLEGGVHFAELTPFVYIEAKKQNPDLILLATQIADGSKDYSAYLIVRDDSGIESLQQLRGRRFAFVDRQSASGYLYPLAYLHKFGIDPATFFSTVVFTGNHETLAKMIQEGEVDGGAVASTILRGMESAEPQKAKLRILAKIGRIPYSAYIATPKLSPALVDQIRVLLLGLSTRDEEGRRVLSGRKTNINGFIGVKDEHYDDVRKVAQLVHHAQAESP
jgi:phosphate/phosphite/phosphonate ABC transporter binding protein